jgi:exopolyphosphatase/guanosine-5'-triphosphate,3'-diphosphate pyrophosphatase
MANSHSLAAGIDLGSNTFRLLVAHCNAGRLEPLEKKLVTVRLARGLTENKFLREENLAKAFEVLACFRKTLDPYSIRHLRICGTEALRTAQNSDFFLQKAHDIMDHPIEIITSKEEAELTLDGALAAFKTARPDTMLLVDVGGSSTELILSQVFHETRIWSIPIGAVSLTEQFLYEPRIKKDAVRKLQGSLVQSLQPALDELKLPDSKKEITLLGCGGTATSMAALDLNLTQYDADLVQGHILQSGRIDSLWDQLSMLAVSERNRISGLENGRGEILPAGIRIYQVLLELLDLKHMSVSDAGLLEGITSSAVPRH